MGKYVLLLNWTDQGIKNVKDTIKRAGSLKSYLEKRGGKLTDILYTFGQYDAIVTAELPSDEVANLLFGLAGEGFARPVEESQSGFFHAVS